MSHGRPIHFISCRTSGGLGCSRTASTGSSFSSSAGMTTSVSTATMVSSFRVWAEGATSSSFGGEVVLTRFSSGVAGVLLLAAGGVLSLSAMLRSTVIVPFEVDKEKTKKRRGGKRPRTYRPRLDSCMVKVFLSVQCEVRGCLDILARSRLRYSSASPRTEQAPLASTRELYFGQLSCTIRR